jgi:hypothetical protein
VRKKLCQNERKEALKFGTQDSIKFDWKTWRQTNEMARQKNALNESFRTLSFLPHVLIRTTFVFLTSKLKIR